MDKTFLTLYGILVFWIIILVGILAFHVAVPIRFLFLMAFLCVGWLAWWTINTIKRAIRGNNTESLVDKPVNKISRKSKE
jgi:hypothetical protein